MTIHIPHPTMDDHGKVKFCTEVAFKILTEEAHKLGLPVEAVTGLEYLSDLEARAKFKAACHAVLESLMPNVP